MIKDASVYSVYKTYLSKLEAHCIASILIHYAVSQSPFSIPKTALKFSKNTHSCSNNSTTGLRAYLGLQWDRRGTTKLKRARVGYSAAISTNLEGKLWSIALLETKLPFHSIIQLIQSYNFFAFPKQSQNIRGTMY